MKISTFLRDMRNSTLIAGLLLLALSATAGPVPTDSVVPADQWQQAQTVSSFPFTTTLNSTTIPLNNDYNLPPTNIADGPDVVYKLIFNQDTYLNASVTSGENGKVALYAEDFGGEDGPGVNNAYNAPAMTGVSQWLGYDTDQHLKNWAIKDWAIKIPKEQLAAYPNCKLTKVAVFDPHTSQSPITVYIYEGGSTPGGSGSSLKRTIEIDANSNDDYHYVDLSSALNLNYNKDLWIAVHADFSSDEPGNPAACSNGNTDPNGRWFKNSGNWTQFTWQSNIAWKVRAFVTNQFGRSMPLGGGREVQNLTVTPGTYYLVASSTSDVFTLNVETGSLTCPDPATNPSPANEVTEVNPNSVNLSWQFGDRTTAYRLKYGTTTACQNTLVNWTSDLLDNYNLTGLNNNTTYYWRVDERNGSCSSGITGTVWSFTTHFNVPTLHADNNNHYVGDNVVLTWTTPSNRDLVSYKLYQDDVLLTTTTQNSYTVSGLAYNMNGYRFNVVAVYSNGESGYSNNVIVYFSGAGTVEGYTYEQDGVTPIANASISISGRDAFNRARSYEFTADASGFYSGSILAGSYGGFANAQGYQTTAYQNSTSANSFSVAYNQTTSGINFNMDELFIPVASVTARFYPYVNDLNSSSVKVTWTPTASAKGDRSFLCYRVYRTDAYNFGPYTSENTTLIADNLGGLQYIDGTWGDVTMGTYKYGVSCVYAGNRDGRESEIVWSNLLSKDMNLGNGQVNITVTLNGGENGEGVLVHFVNLDENEQTYNPQPDVVLGSTGSYAWNAFRKGDYRIELSLDGYETAYDTVSIWAATTMEYQLIENIEEVDRLYVSSTGWAKWDGGGNGYGNRQFTQSEVVLSTTDNTVIWSGTTNTNYIQLPTEGLTEGETYRCKVRNCYSSGNSIWSGTDWEFHPSSGFNGASNLSAEVVSGGYQVAWTYPSRQTFRVEGSGTRGNTAYCICVWGKEDDDNDHWRHGLIKFDITSPWSFTRLNDNEEVFTENSFGLDYCPQDGYYYTNHDYRIYQIDLNSASIVSSVPTTGDFRDGTWDHTTNTMYAVRDNKLYRVNVHTGAVQTVGTMSVSMAAIACDLEGQLYGVQSVETGNAKFYRINKNNASVTLIGTTGKKAPYQQTTAFDLETGNLYWVQSYEGGDNFLRINLNSGGTSTIKANTGGAAGLYIPNHLSSVVGAVVFRDDVAIGFTTDTSFIDAGVTGDHVYGVRVVYGGAALCPDYNHFYSMSPMDTVSIIGPVNPDITQTTALASGWTWYSTFVEQSEVNGLEMLQNSVGPDCNRIQSRTKFTDQLCYQGFCMWDGTLNAITNEESYRIRTEALCEGVITGPAALPENHPITVNPGWNWIGFPSAQSLDLTSALSGFAPVMNDQIKGRYNFATYLGNYGGVDYWDGFLTTLVPGQGYMYRSFATTPKTLVYQTGSKVEILANGSTEGNHYKPVCEEYADNMTVTAEVEIDGTALRSEYELAAFAGDECRGSVKLKYVEPLDRYMAFLMVFGDREEELHFVLTDGNMELRSNEGATFSADAILGNPTEPFVLHFGNTSVSDKLAQSLRVYPNPVACGERFSIGMNDAEERPVRVEIVNALGALVKAETLSQWPASMVAPATAGVYTLKIVVDDKTVVCKRLIVK